MIIPVVVVKYTQCVFSLKVKRTVPSTLYILCNKANVSSHGFPAAAVGIQSFQERVLYRNQTD